MHEKKKNTYYNPSSPKPTLYSLNLLRLSCCYNGFAAFAGSPGFATQCCGLRAAWCTIYVLNHHVRIESPHQPRMGLWQYCYLLAIPPSRGIMLGLEASAQIGHLLK